MAAAGGATNRCCGDLVRRFGRFQPLGEGPGVWLYVLAPIALVHMIGGGRGNARHLMAALVDKRVLAVAGATLIAFSLGHRFPWGWNRFVAHVYSMISVDGIHGSLPGSLDLQRGLHLQVRGRSDGRRFLTRLKRGELGYDLAYRATANAPGWAPMFWEERFRNGREEPFTILDKPLHAIEVWERRALRSPAQGGTH